MDLKKLRELADDLKVGTKAVRLDIVELGCDLSRLLQVIDLYEEYLAASLPIIALDCGAAGTCKDCLEDGRGTHTERALFLVERIDKLREGE